MGFLEVICLLQQSSLACRTQLPRIACSGFQVTEFCLIEAGILCIILPVAIFTYKQRFILIVVFPVVRRTGMLPCRDKDITDSVHPAAGVVISKGKLIFHCRVQLAQEAVRHHRLIERCFPHYYRRMVPVTAAHKTRVTQGGLTEDGVSHELPTRNGIHYQEAKLITGIKEGRGRGVMRTTHEIEPCILDLIDITVGCIVRERIANVWVLLVPVCAGDPDMIAVQQQAIVGWLSPLT